MGVSRSASQRGGRAAAARNRRDSRGRWQQSPAPAMPGGLPLSSALAAPPLAATVAVSVFVAPDEEDEPVVVNVDGGQAAVVQATPPPAPSARQTRQPKQAPVPRTTRGHAAPQRQGTDKQPAAPQSAAKPKQPAVAKPSAKPEKPAAKQPAAKPPEPSPLPKGTWWVSPPASRISPALARARSFPQISGSYESYRAAADNLEELARRTGITILPTTSYEGGGASFNPSTRTIAMHKDICEDPGLYVLALAHEMAHSLDPGYVERPQDYEHEKHRANAEMVAETAALTALLSYGLTISGADTHLQTIAANRSSRREWDSILKSPEVGDRFRCALFPMLRPTDDSAVHRRRHRAYRRAVRYAGARVKRKNEKEARRAASNQKLNSRSGRRRGGRRRGRRR